FTVVQMSPEPGSTARLTGLRSPDANTCSGPPVGFVSRIAARSVSAGAASTSATFDCEPTATYIARSSSEKAMSLVQCPSALPGVNCGTIVSAGPRAWRSPFAYANRTIEFVLTTYTKLGAGPGG